MKLLSIGAAAVPATFIIAALVAPPSLRVDDEALKAAPPSRSCT